MLSNTYTKHNSNTFYTLGAIVSIIFNVQNKYNLMNSV